MPRSPFADYLARFDAGDTIFAAGEEGRTLFVVQSGTVDLLGGHGGDVLMTLEKGDFFGEMSLLEGTPRTYTAMAREDAEAIEIGPALFDRMIRSNIELAVRMLRKLSFRLADLEQRLSLREARQHAQPAVVESAHASPPVPEAPPVPAEAPVVVHDTARAVTDSPGAAPAATPSAGEVAGWLVNPSGSDVFPLQGKRIHIGRFDPVTGTRPEVDLTLLDLKRSVSRRHAVLIPARDGFHLSEEVGALNGTELNGKSLDAGTSVLVRNGDQVSFGGVVLSFTTSAP